MAFQLSDLVLDAKLETKFLNGCVRHTRYAPGELAHRRRIRVTETWDIGRSLGRGSFGNVRLETRRPHDAAPNLSSPRRRAVKVIHKAGPTQPRWDYLKELEAIIKFSNERYAPYFVRTEGWFESPESIFITLEYFPLGDLRALMRESPPFSEDVAQQITRQLVDGIKLMHDCGFAHRDLKPGNILVEAKSPEWLIKIADFGISKRAQEGGTELRTMEVGTLGYMAPEVFGFSPGNDSTVAYSATIDIWAIGVIAFEMLLKKQPFVSVKDLFDYVRGAKQLSLAGMYELGVSASCQEFLKAVLSPNPVTRPTAGSAGNHAWLATLATPMDTEDSLFVDDGSPVAQIQALAVATPASLAWSSVEGSTAPTQGTGTLLSTYHGHQLDAAILLPCFRHLNLETTRYFVMRSNNETDVETSIAHDVWTSSQRVNSIVNRGYHRTGGQVILFFSVIKSRKFCGVAQMTSELDRANTDEHWLEDVWQGRFTMNWLCLNEVSFDLVKHVPVKPTTPGFRAIACYDGTEIAASSAFELLRAFAPRSE